MLLTRSAVAWLRASHSRMPILQGSRILKYSMGGKWLELLKDIASSVQRIAVILNPDSIATRPLFNSIESAAKTFNFEVMKVAVHDAGEIEREIGKRSAEKNIGLMALPDLIPLANRELIIALAMRYGMPTFFHSEYLLLRAH
jgi:putative ABC transport system substrate-binding protein